MPSSWQTEGKRGPRILSTESYGSPVANEVIVVVHSIVFDRGHLQRFMVHQLLMRLYLTLFGCCCWSLGIYNIYTRYMVHITLVSHEV